MLRKILLSSILILAVGCGGKSFKNGVYEGVIGKDPYKLIINNDKNDKVEFIDIDLNSTNYYSKVNDKNENDKDIVYYIKEMLNSLATIYTIDINEPSIFEKVEEWINLENI